MTSFRENTAIAIGSLLTVLVLALAAGLVTWPISSAEAWNLASASMATFLIVRINLYIMEWMDR